MRLAGSPAILESTEGVRVQRAAATPGAKCALVGGWLAVCSAVVAVALLVPQTMASSDVGADAPSASMPVPAAPPRADEGVQIRHVVARGETFVGILRERGLGAT